MNRPVRESADNLKVYLLMGKVESVENEINSYVSPQVELLMVEVEEGFASTSGGTEGYEPDGEIEF